MLCAHAMGKKKLDETIKTKWIEAFLGKKKKRKGKGAQINMLLGNNHLGNI